MKHFLTTLEKSTVFWLLLGISLLFFFLRLPSLIEPYWYGDEGIYQTLGFALQEGRTLYSEMWDNKPPLLYLFYTLFGPEQSTMRLLSLLFGLVTIPIFFLLARKILSSFKGAVVSTILFSLLFGLPNFEGNIANAENFLLLPVLLAVLTFLTALWDTKQKSRQKRYFLLSGMLLGTAFLFKTVAFFDLLSLLLLFLFLTLPKHLTTSSLAQYLERYKGLVINFFTGFVLPIVLSFLVFFLQGALMDYILAAFFGNLDYVGVQNTLLILGGKIILLILVLFVLYKKRTKLSPQLLFLIIWFSFSLFNTFFTHRPYTHYVLVLLPSFCLLTGYLVREKTRMKPILAGVLLITLVLILQFFSPWSLLKTIRYYSNYLSYITGAISSSTYAAFFDSRTPRDMEVASYLKENLQKDDTVFFWGDNAQMYYLTKTLPPGRYTAAYHILNASHAQEETKKVLEEKKPSFIVLFPEVPSFPYPMYNYQQRLSIEGAMIYERIY